MSRRCGRLRSSYIVFPFLAVRRFDVIATLLFGLTAMPPEPAARPIGIAVNHQMATVDSCDLVILHQSSLRRGSPARSWRRPL